MFSYDKPRRYPSDQFPDRENAHYIIPVRRLATAIGIVLHPHIQLGGSAKTARVAQELFELSNRVEPDPSAPSSSMPGGAEQQKGLTIMTGNSSQDLKSAKGPATSPVGGIKVVKKATNNKSPAKISSGGDCSSPAPLCRDGIRRYNSAGEETSSLGSSTAGYSPSSGFLKMFSFLSTTNSSK